MNRTKWFEHIDKVCDILKNVSFKYNEGSDLTPDKGFSEWEKMAVDVFSGKNTIYMIGNGASASMASHFAADLAKNAGIHTEVFSDLSLITAISNDMGYHEVFAEPLRRRGKKGDVLVLISSSGKSSNVLNALNVAKKLGIRTVTLSGMKPDNPLRKNGDLNIYIAGDTYGSVETAHATILHYWMDLVEKAIKKIPSS